MAKKKPADEPRERGARSNLNVWISADLRQVLDQEVDDARQTLTALVTLGLEKLLAERGKWPRKPKKSD